MSRIGVFLKESERSREYDSSISEISTTCYYNDEKFCNAFSLRIIFEDNPTASHRVESCRLKETELQMSYYSGKIVEVCVNQVVRIAKCGVTETYIETRAWRMRDDMKIYCETGDLSRGMSCGLRKFSKTTAQS